MNKKTLTKKKSVLVNFILDKSGSMQSVKSATISGANEYIQSLKNDKKVDYKLTLTLFDTNVSKLFDNQPLSNVDAFTESNYVPNGMTALYDAVCTTIKEVKEKKGQKVITVIMTDGEENSSKEYDEKALKALIDEKMNWTFLFMGANQDSYATAQKYGIHADNTMNFAATNLGVRSAMNVMVSATSNSSCSASTSGFLARQKNVIINVAS